jgi:hypothetical protein
MRPTKLIVNPKAGTNWVEKQKFGPTLSLYTRADGANQDYLYFVVKSYKDGQEANLDMEGANDGRCGFISFLSGPKEENFISGQITAGTQAAGKRALFLDTCFHPERGVSVSGGFGGYDIWVFAYDWDLNESVMRNSEGNIVYAESFLGDSVLWSKLREVGTLDFLNVAGFTQIGNDLQVDGNTFCNHIATTSIWADEYLNLPPVDLGQLWPLWIDQANNRVGIYTYDPQFTLDVDGDANVTGNSNLNTIYTTSIFADQYLNLPPVDPNDLFPLTLDAANGRVGINNPAPAYALDISGGVNIPLTFSYRLGTKVGLALRGSDNSTTVVGETGTIASTTTNAVVIGKTANGSAGSVSIGVGAGQTTQGAGSIAIGNLAGNSNQHTKSIILNASGVALNSTQGSSFFVKPIRNFVDESLPRLSYNATTGEIQYGKSIPDSLLPITLDKTNNRVGIRQTVPQTDLDVNGTTSTKFLMLQSIPNLAQADVLMYDPLTKAVSYAPATTGPQGPEGPKGDTGPQGPQGLKGDTGLQGPEGPKGDTGAQGPQGLKGDTGLQGPKGDTGAQGLKGDTGLQGPQGPIGPQGPPGDPLDLLPITLDKVNNNVGINQTNPQFDLDVNGAINSQAIQTGCIFINALYPGEGLFVGGDVVFDSLPKTDKPEILVYDHTTGKVAYNDLLPITLDKTNNRVGIRQTVPQTDLDVNGTTSTKFLMLQSIPNLAQADVLMYDPLTKAVSYAPATTGPQGPEGPKGDTGPQGPQGLKGDTGLQGPEGPKGDTGAQGPKGDTGLQGPEGPQGLKGDTGLRGPEGPQGLKGDTGLQGPKGDTGAQGLKGDTGLQGPEGPQGLKGDTGLRGPEGPQGLKGDTGLQGPKGDTGAQGLKGDTGLQGPQGPIGPQGPPGDPLDLLPITLDKVNNNVGINQTNPQFDLDVNGAINSQAIQTGCIFINALYPGEGLFVGGDVVFDSLPKTDKPEILVYDHTTGKVAYNDLLPIKLDKTNSRVGINQSAPTQALDITGAARMDRLFVKGTLANQGLIFTDTINNRVGIGSITPATTLDVMGTTTTTNLQLTGIANSAKTNVLMYDTTTKAVSYGPAPSAPFSVTVTSFWITSNVNVLAGESGAIKNLGSLTLQAGTYLLNIHGELGGTANETQIGLGSSPTTLNKDPKNGYIWQTAKQDINGFFHENLSGVVVLTSQRTYYLNASAILTNTVVTTGWTANKTGFVATRLA